MDNNWKYISSTVYENKVNTYIKIERVLNCLFCMEQGPLFRSKLYKHISNGDRTLGQGSSEDNQASNFYSATLQPDQGPS